MKRTNKTNGSGCSGMSSVNDAVRGGAGISNGFLLYWLSTAQSTAHMLSYVTPACSRDNISTLWWLCIDWHLARAPASQTHMACLSAPQRLAVSSPQQCCQAGPALCPHLVRAATMVTLQVMARAVGPGCCSCWYTSRKNCSQGLLAAAAASKQAGPLRPGSSCGLAAAAAAVAASLCCCGGSQAGAGGSGAAGGGGPDPLKRHSHKPAQQVQHVIVQGGEADTAVSPVLCCAGRPRPSRRRSSMQDIPSTGTLIQ
jgi:hypothetical protein